MRATRIRAVATALLVVLPATASSQAPFWDQVSQQAASLLANGGPTGRATFNLLIGAGTSGLSNAPLVVLEWFTEGTAEHGEKRFGYCLKGVPSPDYPAACGSGGHVTGVWNPTATLATTLPEPATMALLATGLVGLAGASILRRHARKLRA